MTFMAAPYPPALTEDPTPQVEPHSSPRKRHHWIVRVTHSVNFIAIVIMGIAVSVLVLAMSSLVVASQEQRGHAISDSDVRDFAEAIQQKYGGGCPGCRLNPCVCDQAEKP